MLGHRDGIAARRIHHEDARRRGRVEIHVIHADTGAPDDAQLRRLLEHIGVHLHGAAHNQRLAVGQMFRILLGIRNDDVPAFLRLEQFNAGLSHGLSDQNVH